ncbi:DoxX family membrane protein [Psychrobacter arcticus]|uniref:DoxX family membrane protein n=1 Tax=Psychrobacter arcticus TaxID=334543 RepID=UPI0000399ACF|nr:DoxX family membrane protein [Psychrobacter arcticus]
MMYLLYLESTILPLVIALELFGDIAILLGFKARLIALLFVGFNIISALLFHQLWIDEAQLMKHK